MSSPAMIRCKPLARGRGPARWGFGLRTGRKWPAARALTIPLLVLISSACGDDGPTDPGDLRFGQVGSIRTDLAAPLRLGEGTLRQTLTWSSGGAWSLRERISYQGVLGDENVDGHTGDRATLAAAYDSVIARLNEETGVELFIPELPSDLRPECGPAETVITFTIDDEARDESATWIRCVDGSLANITPVGAGPDPAAARLAVATQLVRNATVGQGFQSSYAGSVPFATLGRGDETGSTVRSPTTYTDAEAWELFWQAHDGGQRPAPAVDFETQMVVVGIVGERNEAGDSVEVRRVLQIDEGTLMEVFERIPGDFCSPAARLTVPYHIVVAPRLPDPLRFADLRVERVSCGG